jgi:WD40 repeat protein
MQFSLQFHYMISYAPLQAYYSALIFAPETSLVRRTFVNQVQQEVELLSTREVDWEACRGMEWDHSNCVRALAFSPDGQLVASASDDSTARVWEAATGICRSTLEGHSDYIRAVVFSPDGQLVASASDDWTVRVWEVSGTYCSTLEGHNDWVTAVAFSPDGQLIVSSSDDQTVRVWDVVTGKCRSTMETHSQLITAVAFSSDGKILHTNVGDFPSTVPLPSWQKKQPFNIQVQDQWILRNQQRFLWIPDHYRIHVIAVHEDIVCLGMKSGRVVLLRVH